MAHVDMDGLDRIGNRRNWVIGIVAVVLLIIGLVAIIREEQLRGDLEEERDRATVTADQLCDQIKRLGRTCEVSPPPVKGETGRGIKTTRTVDECYVLLTYTDGTSNRVGPFCRTGSVGPSGPAGPQGSPGQPGSPGADGVSISGVTHDGCDLIISFSNGTSVRTGPWCVPGPAGPTGPTGPAGVGIAHDGTKCVKNDDGQWRWRIEYTDGSVDEDAGPCFEPRGKAPEPTPLPSPN